MSSNLSVLVEELFDDAPHFEACVKFPITSIFTIFSSSHHSTRLILGRR